MKPYMKRLYFGTVIVGLLSVANNGFAAAFQLREFNGAGAGDYYAGAAAEANDASTAFANPAGLTQLKNGQIVLGGVIVDSKIKFDGTITTANPFTNKIASQAVSGIKGDNLAIIPNFYYGRPLNDRLAFGFSIASPFGLATDYDIDTATRYAATNTSLKTIDISPSLAYKLTDNFSLGAGFDAEYIRGEFDSYVGFIDAPNMDTSSTNKGDAWGYGYHLGALYSFAPGTRVGLTYRSQIVANLTGTSTFAGYLANGGKGGVQVSHGLETTVTLPPVTSLGFYHDINSQWAALGTVSYTEWSSFKNLTLKNVAGPSGNNSISNIPENYKNSWSVALGTHYAPCQKLMFRAGIGYDQSPANDTDRNLQLPDSNRIAAAVGVHYQESKAVGVDLGWTHLFFTDANINNVNKERGVITKGNIDSQANIFGVQLTWNLDT